MPKLTLFPKKPEEDIMKMRKLPVKDFLDEDCGSREVLTVTTDISPEEILKRLVDPTNREDAVVVIAHKSSPTVGVITHSDFLDWTGKFVFPHPKRDYRKYKAAHIAKEKFFYITEDEQLEKAIQLMKKEKTSKREDHHSYGIGLQTPKNPLSSLYNFLCFWALMHHEYVVEQQ